MRVGWHRTVIMVVAGTLIKNVKRDMMGYKLEAIQFMKFLALFFVSNENKIELHFFSLQLIVCATIMVLWPIEIV